MITIQLIKEEVVLIKVIKLFNSNFISFFNNYTIRVFKPNMKNRIFSVAKSEICLCSNYS